MAFPIYRFEPLFKHAWPRMNRSIIKLKFCNKPRITRMKPKNIYKIANKPWNTLSPKHNPMYFIGFICVNSCHS